MNSFTLCVKRYARDGLSSKPMPMACGWMALLWRNRFGAGVIGYSWCNGLSIDRKSYLILGLGGAGILERLSWFRVQILCGRLKMADIWYLLLCRECATNIPMIFGSASERGKWAAAHTKGTGHDKWVVLDAWVEMNWTPWNLACE